MGRETERVTGTDREGEMGRETERVTGIDRKRYG